MRKSLLLVTVTVAVIFPCLALAAFTRPSDMLLTLMYDGKPRQFEGKFYVSVPLEGDTVRFFGKTSGMSEGRTLKDTKMSLRADIAVTMAEGELKGAIEMMAYRQKFYVRLTDVAIKAKRDAAGAAELMASISRYQDRWFVWDLPDEVFDRTTVMGGSGLSQEEAKQLLAVIADSFLSLEHTRTKIGNTYLLTLTKEWAEALTSAINGVGEMNPDLADTLSSEEVLPVLATSAEAYANALTARLKVDTTREGDFRFARYYTTFTLPDDEGEPVIFAIEGTAQHRPKPVYLEVPKEAEPLESVLGDFLPSLGPSEEEWMVPEEEELEFPTEERPILLPLPSPSCSAQGSVRGADISTQELCPGGRESRRLIRERRLRELNR
jgi:hypothetical protein